MKFVFSYLESYQTPLFLYPLFRIFVKQSRSEVLRLKNCESSDENLLEQFCCKQLQECRKSRRSWEIHLGTGGASSAATS